MQDDGYLESEAAIVLCADDGYAMYATIAAFSAIRSTPELRLKAYIWPIEWRDETVRRFETAKRRKGFNVELLQIPSTEIADIATADFVTIAASGRLCLPSYIPIRTHTAIYLDADTFVRSSLAPLVERSFQEDRIVGVAPDAVFRVVSQNPAADCLVRAGMKHDSSYFNSGVMVIDIQGWGETKVFAQARDFISTNRTELRHHDQDALNVVLRESTYLLDAKWNFQTQYTVASQSRHGEEADEARIVHFTGRKPDDAKSFHPLRGEYLRLALLSGYFSGLEYVQWRLRLWLPRVPLHCRRAAHRLGLGRLRRLVSGRLSA